MWAECRKVEISEAFNTVDNTVEAIDAEEYVLLQNFRKIFIRVFKYDVYTFGWWIIYSSNMSV